jgi:hypothetical protein
MKGILVCLLILGLNGDYIYWNQRRMLDWEDYKVKTSLPTDETAVVRSAWDYDTPWHTKGSTLYININTVFVKSASWVKRGNESEYLLRHEQGHYDIAEANARKYRKAVKEFNFNRATLQKDLDSLHQYYYALCFKEQEQYDLETKHSLNKEVQEQWISRIMGELEKGMNYWNPEIETTMN